MNSKEKKTIDTTKKNVRQSSQKKRGQKVKSSDSKNKNTKDNTERTVQQSSQKIREQEVRSSNTKNKKTKDTTERSKQQSSQKSRVQKVKTSDSKNKNTRSSENRKTEKKKNTIQKNVEKSSQQKTREQRTKQHQPQKKKQSRTSKKKEVNYFEKYNKEKLLSPDEQKNKDIKEFLEKLKIVTTNELLIPAKSKILLAVSGGVDSVAMLDAMFQLAGTYEYELIVCHYNHKLRGMSSDNDEKLVKRLAGQYGLKFLSDSGDVKSFAKHHSQSIEQAARTLRYNFFERTANSHQVPYVMLAHTADDSAETVLLNLLRGSGLTGLGGIPVRRALGRKNQIVRPLITFKKTALISYANQRMLKWHEDETNSFLNFTRNKIRHGLMIELKNEYNPQIVDTLNRTANIIRLADEFVKEHLAPYMNNFKWSKKKGLLSISIPLFDSCGTFIQGEILQAKLKDKFNLGNLSQNMIERIITLPNLEVGSFIEIGKNIIALRDRNNLLFYRDKKQQYFEADIFKGDIFENKELVLKLSKISKKQMKINNDPNIEYLDYDLVPAVLKLRTWQPGDSFIPLGMSGNMKISDFLINQKVSLLDKKDVLVLASKNDILWVCGMRISDKFKVTSSTTRFLKIEYHKKDNNNE
jgi:tRNA(Ile)-lysidine synthase